MSRRSLPTAGVVLTLLLSGAPSLADVEDDGGRLYREFCATCHGEEGDGRGPSARFVEPPPRDLREGAFRFISTEPDEPPALDDIVRTVRVGLAGTSMPPWAGVLNEAEIQAVSAFVLSMRPPSDEAPEPVVVPPPTPARPGARARGAAEYRRLGCVQCHGEQGRGDGPSTRLEPGLKDEAGRPCPPTDLTQGWFKGGSDAATVVDAVVRGRPGTPMPSYAGAASPEQLWDLARFVLSLSERGLGDYLLVDPAGRATLPGAGPSAAGDGGPPVTAGPGRPARSRRDTASGTAAPARSHPPRPTPD